MRIGRWVRLGLLGIAGAFAVGACLGATQITVHVTTNASCMTVDGSMHFVELGIATGLPGKVDPTLPNGTSMTCAALSERLGNGYGPNDLGTLALVPGGAKDGPLEVIVIGAVDSPTVQGVGLKACETWASTGETPAGYRNFDDPDTSNPVIPCIIEKRSLTFTAHEAFELPIQLDSQCTGVKCRPGYTCADQMCVSEQTACREGANCMLGGTGGAGGMPSTTASKSVSVTSTGPSMTTSSTGSKMTTSSTSATMTASSTGTSMCDSTTCANMCPGGTCGPDGKCDCPTVTSSISSTTSVSSTTSISSSVSSATGTCCASCNAAGDTCDPNSCSCCNLSVCAMNCGMAGLAGMCTATGTCQCFGTSTSNSSSVSTVSVSVSSSSSSNSSSSGGGGNCVPTDCPGPCNIGDMPGCVLGVMGMMCGCVCDTQTCSTKPCGGNLQPMCDTAIPSTCVCM